MGSPAKASAAATGAVQEEGQEAASDTDRGHANGGPEPATLDLNIKALMERRKQLRQEKQEVAKTLKKAVSLFLFAHVHNRCVLFSKGWHLFFSR